MKIPSGEIEKIVNPFIESKYEGLNHVYFDAENKRLIASNGCGLVRCSVETADGDVSGSIPVAVMKFARDQYADNISVEKDSIKVMRKDEVLGMFPKPNGTFPKVDELFFHENGCAMLIFNPQVLLDAVMAMQVRPTQYEDEPEFDQTADMNMVLFLPPDPRKQSFLIAPLDLVNGFGGDASMCAVVMPCRADRNGKDATPTLEDIMRRGARIEVPAE